jgi:hypothetical protein
VACLFLKTHGLKEVMAVEADEVQDFLKECVRNLEIDFEVKRRQVRMEMERTKKVLGSKRTRLNGMIDDRSFEMQIVAAQFAATPHFSSTS